MNDRLIRTEADVDPFAGTTQNAEDALKDTQAKTDPPEKDK